MRERERNSEEGNVTHRFDEASAREDIERVINLRRAALQQNEKGYRYVCGQLSIN